MKRIDAVLGDTLAQLHTADVREMPAHYSPPYESPIAALFARQAQPHWRPDVRVAVQVTVMTRLGPFRPNFIVTAADGWQTGVECDWAAFHDPIREAFRDAAILGAGAVDSIVRLRGADLVTRPSDILYAFDQAFPATFSARGPKLARQRASRPAWEQVPAGWGR